MADRRRKRASEASNEENVCDESDTYVEDSECLSEDEVEQASTEISDTEDVSDYDSAEEDTSYVEEESDQSLTDENEEFAVVPSNSEESFESEREEVSHERVSEIEDFETTSRDGDISTVEDEIDEHIIPKNQDSIKVSDTTEDSNAPTPIPSDHEEDTLNDDEKKVIVENEKESNWEESEEASEETKKEQLDSDQDVKNPAYIPRVGRFYQHDARTDDNAESGDATKNTEWEEKISAREKYLNQKDRWDHDGYDPYAQAPKTREEIILTYGYDIRELDHPPEAHEVGRRGDRFRGLASRSRDEHNIRGSQRLGDFLPDNLKAAEDRRNKNNSYQGKGVSGDNFQQKRQQRNAYRNNDDHVVPGNNNDFSDVGAATNPSEGSEEITPAHETPISREEKRSIRRTTLFNVIDKNDSVTYINSPTSASVTTTAWSTGITTPVEKEPFKSGVGTSNTSRRLNRNYKSSNLNAASDAETPHSYQQQRSQRFTQQRNQSGLPPRLMDVELYTNESSPSGTDHQSSQWQQQSPHFPSNTSGTGRYQQDRSARGRGKRFSGNDNAIDDASAHQLPPRLMGGSSDTHFRDARLQRHTQKERQQQPPRIESMEFHNSRTGSYGNQKDALYFHANEETTNLASFESETPDSYHEGFGEQHSHPSKVPVIERGGNVVTDVAVTNANGRSSYQTVNYRPGYQARRPTGRGFYKLGTTEPMAVGRGRGRGTAFPGYSQQPKSAGGSTHDAASIIKDQYRDPTSMRNGGNFTDENFPVDSSVSDRTGLTSLMASSSGILPPGSNSGGGPLRYSQQRMVKTQQQPSQQTNTTLGSASDVSSFIDEARQRSYIRKDIFSTSSSSALVSSQDLMGASSSPKSSLADDLIRGNEALAKMSIETQAKLKEQMVTQELMRNQLDALSRQNMQLAAMLASQQEQQAATLIQHQQLLQQQMQQHQVQNVTSNDISTTPQLTATLSAASVSSSVTVPGGVSSAHPGMLSSVSSQLVSSTTGLPPHAKVPQQQQFLSAASVPSTAGVIPTQATQFPPGGLAAAPLSVTGPPPGMPALHQLTAPQHSTSATVSSQIIDSSARQQMPSSIPPGLLPEGLMLPPGSAALMPTDPTSFIAMQQAALSAAAADIQLMRTGVPPPPMMNQGPPPPHSLLAGQMGLPTSLATQQASLPSTGLPRGGSLENPPSGTVYYNIQQQLPNVSTIGQGPRDVTSVVMAAASANNKMPGGFAHGSDVGSVVGGLYQQRPITKRPKAAIPIVNPQGEDRSQSGIITTSSMKSGSGDASNNNTSQQFTPQQQRVMPPPGMNVTTAELSIKYPENTAPPNGQLAGKTVDSISNNVGGSAPGSHNNINTMATTNGNAQLSSSTYQQQPGMNNISPQSLAQSLSVSSTQHDYSGNMSGVVAGTSNNMMASSNVLINGAVASNNSVPEFTSNKSGGMSNIYQMAAAYQAQQVK